MARLSSRPIYLLPEEAEERTCAWAARLPTVLMGLHFGDMLRTAKDVVSVKVLLRQTAHSPLREARNVGYEVDL
jgi:hypothetical protein